MYHDDLEVARLGWPGFVWEENFFPRFNCDAINIKFYVNLTQVFIVSIKKLVLLPKINKLLGGILSLNNNLNAPVNEF